MAAPGNPTMIQGVRARTNLSTNREDTDYMKGIALLDPNENPFTLATMDMGRDTSKTIDKHWFEDELVPEHAQVNYSTGYNSSDTSILLDTGQGKRFAAGDLAKHEVTGEVMFVASVSTDTLTVIRDYGQDESGNDGWAAKAGAVSDNDFLQNIGNGFEQGHTLPVIKSTQEVEYKNYCQDIRTPIGISEIVDATTLRGEQDLSFQEMKAGKSHSRKIELTALWGKPYAGTDAYWGGTDDNSVLPQMSGGINHFIEVNAPTAQKKDEDEITQSEFQDFMEFVFEYGSATKFCYCPAKLRTALDKWGISKLNTFTSETIFGMAVSVWRSSHGEVVFVTHKMLKQPQASQYYHAFFLDMEEVKFITLQKIGATRLRKMDPYNATGETGIKEEYQTISCIKFGQAAKHARLRFKTIGS